MLKWKRKCPLQVLRSPADRESDSAESPDRHESGRSASDTAVRDRRRSAVRCRSKLNRSPSTLPPSRKITAPRVAPDVGAKLGREIQKREAADRQSRAAQRRDFVAAPPAQVGRAAKEVALEKRNLQFGRTERVDASRSRLRRSDDPAGKRSEQAQLAGDLVVVPRARQPLAGLFEMNRGDVALLGIEQVVRRVPAAIEADRGSRAASGPKARIEARARSARRETSDPRSASLEIV